MTRPRRRPLAAAAFLVALALHAGASAQAGRGPERPEPTEGELQQIREHIGQLGRRGRQAALRVEAAAALGRFGPRAAVAVPALVTALGDPDLSVASTAAVALGRVGTGSTAAVRGLVEALTRGRDVALRVAAAEGLGLLGEDAAPAAPALAEALAHADADLRVAAAAALGRLGARAERHARTLRAHLADDQLRVRVAAATSLVRLGDAGADLPPILAGAARPGSRVPLPERETACEALGLLGAGAASAVQALVAALREEPEAAPGLPFSDERRAQHDSMRRAAATALGRIGAREAVPALRAAADVPALRDAATAALAALGEDPDAG